MEMGGSTDGAEGVEEVSLQILDTLYESLRFLAYIMFDTMDYMLMNQIYYKY